MYSHRIEAEKPNFGLVSPGHGGGGTSYLWQKSKEKFQEFLDTTPFKVGDYLCYSDAKSGEAKGDRVSIILDMEMDYNKAQWDLHDVAPKVFLLASPSLQYTKETDGGMPFLRWSNLRWNRLLSPEELEEIKKDVLLQNHFEQIRISYKEGRSKVS